MIDSLLVLGGIHEAKALVPRLMERGYRVIYSEAGKGRYPDVPCEIHWGGFGGVAGLRDFIITRRVIAVIDLTHPYAAQIHSHAVQASQAAGVPLLRWLRPCWTEQAGDRWRQFNQWSQLLADLKKFQRVFFALGNAPLQHLAAIGTGQHWFIRLLNLPQNSTAHAAYTLMAGVGAISTVQEVHLFKTLQIEVVVCKNSGGTAGYAKIAAARELALPVMLWTRPKAPQELAQNVMDFNLLEELFQYLSMRAPRWGANRPKKISLE